MARPSSGNTYRTSPRSYSPLSEGVLDDPAGITPNTTRSNQSVSITQDMPSLDRSVTVGFFVNWATTTLIPPVTDPIIMYISTSHITVSRTPLASHITYRTTVTMAIGSMSRKRFLIT